MALPGWPYPRSTRCRRTLSSVAIRMRSPAGSPDTVNMVWSGPGALLVGAEAAQRADVSSRDRTAARRRSRNTSRSAVGGAADAAPMAAVAATARMSTALASGAESHERTGPGRLERLVLVLPAAAARWTRAAGAQRSQSSQSRMAAMRPSESSSGQVALVGPSARADRNKQHGPQHGQLRVFRAQRDGAGRRRP